MNRQNVILISVFVILLLAIVGELVYFVFIPKQSGQIVPAVSPTPSAADLNGPQLVEFPPLFNEDTIKVLSKFPKVPGSVATVRTEVDVEVGSINYTEVTYKKNKYPFSLKFRYIGDDVLRGLFFAQWEIEKLKVFVVDHENKTPANFTDIKKGDKIKMINVLNPYYAPDDRRQLVELELDIMK